MILLIKPTSACNFCCDFCSIKDLKIKMQRKHVPQQIKDLIKKLKPDWISVTGGEPLTQEPSYFYELLDLIDGEVAMTSNLKYFYENPDKWVPLFKNPRITVCTSFQYGNGRKWDKNTPFTEEKFSEIIKLYEEKVGREPPQFIAVITEENYDRALDHLYLAKKLNTRCKLNRVLSLGGAKDDYFPFAKMIDLYYEIKKRGLDPWYADIDSFQFGTCNINTNLLCDSTTRATWVKQDGTLEYGNCEDLLASGMSKRDINEERPNQLPTELNPEVLISKNCLTCELCKLCNACEANRFCNKKDPNHCQEMLKRMDKIKEMKWLL